MFNTVRAKLKHHLDTRYPAWDLSIALRYLPIVDDLKQIQQKNESILEVGSEIEGITPYLQQPVTGVDLGFDYSRANQWLTPVKGSATKLPFQNRSFDYVLSVDMLEHLLPTQREQAIKEMLRVADKKVYLAFPCGSASAAVDRELDRYFFNKNGQHFDYLAEHVKLGLPPCDLVPQLARRYPDWQLTVHGNTSLWLWRLMLKLGLSNEIIKTSLYRRLLFLLPLLKHCHLSPTYRRLYIFTKLA